MDTKETGKSLRVNLNKLADAKKDKLDFEIIKPQSVSETIEEYNQLIKFASQNEEAGLVGKLLSNSAIPVFPSAQEYIDEIERKNGKEINISIDYPSFLIEIDSDMQERAAQQKRIADMQERLLENQLKTIECSNIQVDDKKTTMAKTRSEPPQERFNIDEYQAISGNEKPNAGTGKGQRSLSVCWDEYVLWSKRNKRVLSAKAFLDFLCTGKSKAYPGAKEESKLRKPKSDWKIQLDPAEDTISWKTLTRFVDRVKNDQ